MTQIQAFFWDYDNTILETVEAHIHKHRVILAKNGIELSDAFHQRIYENNGYQNWAWMKEELGLKVAQKEYLEAVDTEFQRHLETLEMRPGVAELFKLIDGLDIPQAIVTNARRNSAEPVLRAKNILPMMQFVLFKEDYEGKKPDPMPYLTGFKKMESLLEVPLEPKRCIAIEDDPKGVESANKAGAIVIHRRLRETEAPSPYAHYSCFHEEDFIRIVRALILI
ncbi:MAG: HAD family phosphatase [Simkania sp.]|nr:HAD family phosphatase [Simkania sp.]